MSRPTEPKPAKLVVGFFLNDKALGIPVAENLIESFGDVDIVSPWMPFDQTRYYEPEMGSPLYRRVMAFQELIRQSDLAGIKHMTNDIEKRYAENGKRSVNIDPGYMLFERFVLATGKNFSHRIYIGKRIYADLTLIFKKGRFESLPWTFPDYAGDRLQAFLMSVRAKYGMDMKSHDGVMTREASKL